MAERRSDNICTNSMSYMQHSLQWNTATRAVWGGSGCGSVSACVHAVYTSQCNYIIAGILWITCCSLIGTLDSIRALDVHVWV